MIVIVETLLSKNLCIAKPLKYIEGGMPRIIDDVTFRGEERKFMCPVLEKNLNAFIHIHVGDVYYELLKTNDRLSEIKYEKAIIIGKEILKDCSSLNSYEELENEYIAILTEEIYKQALCDFAEINILLNK